MSTWNWTGPMGESGGLSVGKGGECDVESWHLQGFSPCLCQLRTEGLVPMGKYWIYWSHAGDLSPVNRCSHVTIWLNFFSPTPRLSRGRKNDVAQDDGRAHQSLVVNTSSVCRGLFWPCSDYTKDCHVRGLPARSIWVAYVDRRGNYTCHVYQVFFAGCTLIQISVTLGYE
jgi:hypothetical protein